MSKILLPSHVACIVYMMVYKNVKRLIIPDNKLDEISYPVGIYDRGRLFSRSRDSRHIRRMSIAAAVQHGNPPEKLVSLGSVKNCTTFVGTKIIPFFLAIVPTLLHGNARPHTVQETDQNLL
jgi:hypothetical protein